MNFKVAFAFLLSFSQFSQAFHLTKETVEKQPSIKKRVLSLPKIFSSAKRSSSFTVDENKIDDYFDDDYYTYRFGTPEYDESQCSEDMYWHARSFKCVPYDCPGGNQYRDKHSGDCLLKVYGNQNYHNNNMDDRPLRNHK